MATQPNHLIHSFQHSESTDGNFDGLTKREYFAAMAMQGIIASQNPGSQDPGGAKRTAEDAALLADALIAALNKDSE